MKNAELVCCIGRNLPVMYKDKILTPIEYSIKLSKEHVFTPLAGCVDQNNVFHQIPLAEVFPCISFKPEKPIKIDWNGLYSAERIKNAMKSGEKVSVDGIEYDHIAELKIRTDSMRQLGYSATCVDRNGCSVSVNISKLQLEKKGEKDELHDSVLQAVS